VNGTIYAVDAGGPLGSVVDPGLLTTAKDDLTAAYNDTAARTNVAVVNPGSGNIGGMTLGPGVYKFTSSALITGADVTLTGGADAVWIFQMPSSTLTVGNGIKVHLAGAAQAKNIFWSVGSSATLGTTCVVYGNILADQSITLQTGATLIGRALTRIAAVTLDANTVTAP